MGSSPSPPPAPNAYQTAAQQSQENVQAAIAQTWLNNVNQVTPYGTITYDKIGEEIGPHGNLIPRFQATTELSPKMLALYRSNIANAQRTSELENELLANARFGLSRPLDLGWSETEASGPLQPLRKDLMIRFRHESGGGGDHGGEASHRKEICRAVERRRA